MPSLSSFTPRDYYDEDQYRYTLISGIAAVKSGNLDQARTLLKKAVEMKFNDPQPWLWLSATTDDLSERREYLEYALAADPNNGAARRGLVFLSEKLDKSRARAEGEGYIKPPTDQPVDAQSETIFLCDRCGGKLSFDVARQVLVCDYCGYEQKPDLSTVADQEEQAFDFVLPTTRAQTWSEARHRLTCQQCGAISLLAIGESALTCPHCGSHQLIESAELTELVQPNVIAPAKIDLSSAANSVQEWLGKGWFIPDDLKKLARPSVLRPVYYPFWTFDGILQMSWVCEVNRGTSKSPIWEAERGVEFEIFDDELVPGISKLPKSELSQIEPFDLKSVVAYDNAFLAGWDVLAYDYPLAEASLDAREMVAKRLQRELIQRVFPGKEKRNMQSGETSWSGLTYKLVLLPLYVGSYQYRGQSYQLYVNGQTGKVAGYKPEDRLKKTAFWLTVIFGLMVLSVLALWVGLSLGWIRF